MALPTKAVYLDQLTQRPSHGGNDPVECPICHDVAADPTETPCKHVFCLRCLARWVEGNKLANSRCPYCREELCEPPHESAELEELEGRASLYPKVEHLERLEGTLASFRVTLNRDNLKDYMDEHQTFRLLSPFRSHQLADVEYLFDFDFNLDEVNLAILSPTMRFKGVSSIEGSQETVDMWSVGAISYALHKLFADHPLVLHNLVCTMIRQIAERERG